MAKYKHMNATIQFGSRIVPIYNAEIEKEPGGLAEGVGAFDIDGQGFPAGESKGLITIGGESPEGSRRYCFYPRGQLHLPGTPQRTRIFGRVYASA